LELAGDDGDKELGSAIGELGCTRSTTIATINDAPKTSVTRKMIFF
jgi:hypothetical protein